MRWIIAGLSIGLVAGACTPTCASTCNRYYSPEECDARPAGISEAEATNLCVTVCETAMRTPGPAPSINDRRFSGTSSAPATTSPQIANELEAAAWMDCVWSFEDRETCQDKLDKQFCVPVF